MRWLKSKWWLNANGAPAVKSGVSGVSQSKESDKQLVRVDLQERPWYLMVKEEAAPAKAAKDQSCVNGVRSPRETLVL